MSEKEEEVENIKVVFDGNYDVPNNETELVKRKISEDKNAQESELEMNSPVKVKAPKKPFKERFNSFVDGFYNKQYREFLSKDAMGWLKLSAFYAAFYLWLASFFCFLLFLFWTTRIRGQTLPVYYNTDSVMNYKVVNPGLGFRPHLNPESDLIFIKTSDSSENVKSLNNFLEFYEKNKNVEFTGAHDESVNFNYEEIVKNTPCSKENSYGLGSKNPCVVVKLNRIIGWVPQSMDLSELPDGLNKTVMDLEDNEDIGAKKNFVYVACGGQYAFDKDNIEEIEYFSSHFTNEIGGINFKYFPYTNQENYLSPLIFVHFKKVSPNTLLNVICKAYGGNIDNEDRLNQRGMVKFQVYIEDLSDKIDDAPAKEDASSEEVEEKVVPEATVEA